MCPIRMLYGCIIGKNNTYMLPMIFPGKTIWGESFENDSYNISKDSDLLLHVGWIGLNTRKVFYFENSLPLPMEIVDSQDITLLIGLSDNGRIVLWLQNDFVSNILLDTYGVNITNNVTDSMIKEIGIKRNDGVAVSTISQLCDYGIERFINFLNIAKDDFAASFIIDDKMKKFCSQYMIKGLFEEAVNTLNVLLWDGTYNKLNDGSLLKYHQAGKPKKLAIKWHIGKSEYSAYFWFEEEPIREVFDKFYGAHPDTKTDFIIRIDAENRKYELALYRYGLKEPQIIPENVYQLLVFKNRFEDYRSNNYNQERGAWIW